MANLNNGPIRYSGIIYSITPDPTGAAPSAGEVQQDETGDFFPFTGQNLTGLSVNSLVSFTLNVDRYGNSNAGFVTALTMNPPQIINTSQTEDITAILGDIIRITNGATLTGTVNINGGKVVVEANSAVNGAVNVTAGGIMVAKGGNVGGGMININTGGSLKAVKGGSVSGSTININQGGRMIAGDSTGTGNISTTPGTLSFTGGLRGVSVAADGTSSIIG